MPADSFSQANVKFMMRRAMASAEPAEYSALEPAGFACFTEDHNETMEINGVSYTSVGTSSGTKRSSIVLVMLGLDAVCLLPRCGFLGGHIRTIRVEQKFCALSAVFFTANYLDLNAWSEAKAVTPKAILEVTRRLCRTTRTGTEAAYPDAELRPLRSSRAAAQFSTGLSAPFGFAASKQCLHPEMSRPMEKGDKVILNAEGASNQLCLPRSMTGEWVQ